MQPVSDCAAFVPSCITVRFAFCDTLNVSLEGVHGQQDDNSDSGIVIGYFGFPQVNSIDRPSALYYHQEVVSGWKQYISQD